MKYSLTLSLFLGLISKETAAIKLQHSHNKHHSHHQRLAQQAPDAWIDDCYPDRNPYA